MNQAQITVTLMLPTVHPAGEDKEEVIRSVLANHLGELVAQLPAALVEASVEIVGPIEAYRPVRFNELAL